MEPADHPSLTLTQESAPDAATARAIEAGLDAYNESVVPYGDWAPLWIVGRDGAGSVQAGLRAITVYDWMFVIWLWVGAAHRGAGIGSRLLSRHVQLPGAQILRTARLPGIRATRQLSPGSCADMAVEDAVAGARSARAYCAAANDRHGSGRNFTMWASST